MKNVWKCPGLILAIVLISVDSFPQGSKATDYENLAAKQNATMKLTTDMQLYPGAKSWIMDDIELNYPRAARKFALLFPAATSIRWFKEENTLFAYFFTNGRKAYAVFTLQGRMNYAITWLEPADLPAYIINKIGEEYSACSIFNIKKILIYGYAVFRIILENEYEFIHVQITDTDIEEIEKFKKSFRK